MKHFAQFQSNIQLRKKVVQFRMKRILLKSNISNHKAIEKSFSQRDSPHNRNKSNRVFTTTNNGNSGTNHEATELPGEVSTRRVIGRTLLDLNCIQLINFDHLMSLRISDRTKLRKF